MCEGGRGGVLTLTDPIICMCLLSVPITKKHDGGTLLLVHFPVVGFDLVMY